MPLVNFSSLDFAQVKSSLREYLRANSDFTDYDFEGSNLSAILDVLAYNTYITSYNANMVANEVFIDTATLRENVVSLARNIGYLPRSVTSAYTDVSFFVDCSTLTVKPSTLTLKRGPVCSSAGTFGGGSGIFSILEDITVPVYNQIASFDNITVYEGTLVHRDFTYKANYPNKKFILPNSGIDTNLISVKVRPNESSSIQVKYSLQDDLFDVSSTSKIYYLQEIADERYEIFFGDGIFGNKLEENNFIEAHYIVSNGDAGNRISSFNFAGKLSYTLNSVNYSVTSKISAIIPGAPSSGGAGIEPVESIKKYAPKIYATQNRAITPDDYETIIPAKIYPETESISAFGGEDLVPPQFGKVFVSIKPKNGDFVPNLIKEKIKSKLKKYAVAGIIPEILDLKYLNIEVDSKVYYNSNLVSSGEYISSVVQNNIQKYSESTDLNKYGARFKYSKFLSIVDNSHESITSNITRVRMRRDMRVVTSAYAEYTIGFGNPFLVGRTSGYNIKSSAFRVTGIVGDVYFSDLPNSDGVTGSLFFFNLPALNSLSPTIIRRNVGKIDYANGIITLNPVNIASGMIYDGQSVIQIQADPLSNDVIGLQDLYLRLDISGSVIEPITDQISSGTDPTASTYVLSPSYPGGSLVRSGGRTT